MKQNKVTKLLALVILAALVCSVMAIFAGCGPKLEEVPAKDASCEYDGNILYYKNTKTGKLYSDAEGTKEISQEDTVIPATGHSYSDKWSADATNHWHQATCEHTDKIKDRAEHTFPNQKDIKDGTGLECLKCTVCDYERGVEDAYQMYIVGNISSHPTTKWDSLFAKKADIADNCIKLTYKPEDKSFSAEVLLNPRDEFGVYNIVAQQMYPGNAAQGTTGALRVEARGVYVVTWKIGTTKPTVELHEHQYTVYGKNGSQHWLECVGGDSIKEGSYAPHDNGPGVKCDTCGFDPATCTHPQGFKFMYATYDEDNPIPTPVAEGGTLVKVCPDCYKTEDVAYNKGIQNQKPEITTTDELYYIVGNNRFNFTITEAGTYTLTIENVSHGEPTPDSTSTRMLRGLTIDYSKYGVLASESQCLWFNTYEDTNGWSTTKTDMVQQWQSKIKINGSSDYAPAITELNSIEITVTDEDLTNAGGNIYVTVWIAIGSSFSATNNNAACLAKLTCTK